MPLIQLQATGQPFPPGEPDVQRTSFSLDVLGRFVCSTYDEATTNPDFDVVVIGSGMYGSYCAAKIYSESAKPGRTPLRVLVLEAGPFLVHEHGQNIPDLGLGNPFRPVTDTFGPDAQRTRDLVWGIGWRGNVGLSRHRLLRRRQVDLLGRLVPAPARCGPAAMAGGSPRLPERAARFRQQPSEPACACGRAIGLPGCRVRDRRPSRGRLRLRSGPRAGGAAGPHRPQRRARRAPEGGAGGLAPERRHAARRPRAAADRGADPVLRLGRLLAGQVQQPHAADLGDPRRAGPDERRHAAGARLQPAAVPGAERPCRAARGRRRLPRRRAAPGRQGHGGRALRRRRPQGPAGEARLHRRAGARLHRVRRGSRSSPSPRRRTAPATS